MTSAKTLCSNNSEVPGTQEFWGYGTAPCRWVSMSRARLVVKTHAAPSAETGSAPSRSSITLVGPTHKGRYKRGPWAQFTGDQFPLYSQPFAQQTTPKLLPSLFHMVFSSSSPLTLPPFSFLPPPSYQWLYWQAVHGKMCACPHAFLRWGTPFSFGYLCSLHFNFPQFI